MAIQLLWDILLNFVQEDRIRVSNCFALLVGLMTILSSSRFSGPQKESPRPNSNRGRKCFTADRQAESWVSCSSLQPLLRGHLALRGT